MNDAVEAIETALLDGAPLHIDDVNERVGIGITSPTSPLHIKADSFDMLALDRTDNANVDQQVILTPTYSGAGNTAFAIKIGSEIMRVTEEGRVGIGTASPSTTLHVDGSILANDSVTIGDGGEYVAGSIYSDANWGMIFRAKQASPAAADFRWANSADTERMRIDTSGRVTMPYQPSFRAYLNVSPNPTYGSGWSVMSWNTTDFNVGGHYNTTNYRFTAPVAGKYLFTTSVNFYNIAQGDRFIVEFLKSNAYSYRLTDIDSYNAIGDDRNLGGSIIMNLSANDYVQVRAYGATANWRRSAGYNYAHFAGHFLG